MLCLYQMKMHKENNSDKNKNKIMFLYFVKILLKIMRMEILEQECLEILSLSSLSCVY